MSSWSPSHGSALQNPGAVLNRLTLGFLDADIERDFRLQRAEASRAILRRFIIFMVVLSVFITTGIHHKLESARAAGIPVPPQLDMSGAGLVAGGALGAVLFLATLSRRFVPYLHLLTAACMAGLIVVDNWHYQHIPAAYALYGTLLNLVVVYVASQLRFVAATLLGVAASLLHLCWLAARLAPELHVHPELRLQMGVTAMLVACANLILMFVAHQRELLARLAYYRARLLEQRGAELEAALASLKQAEMQLVETEKQATVGRLVAGILHEMNTPLGALESATQTLARGLARLRAAAQQADRGGVPRAGLERPDVGQQELLGKLEVVERLAQVQAASGERIRSVVQGLGQFVALDRAALQVADVRSGLEQAVSLIRPALGAGVKLTLEVPTTPIWVKCSPARLNQVFLNLLENAAHAFDPGAEHAEVAVRASVHAGRTCVEIRDTGRGIDPARLPRIFELDFSRQGSRVKLNLGLPASRSVVEAMGGTLTLESEPGRGSRALIDLPLAETSAPPQQPSPRRSSRPEAGPSAVAPGALVPSGPSG